MVRHPDMAERGPRVYAGGLCGYQAAADSGGVLPALRTAAGGEPPAEKGLYERNAPSPAGMVLLLVLLFLGLMRVTAGTYSAFIYFQF